MLGLVLLMPALGIGNVLMVRRHQHNRLKRVALIWSLCALTATNALWASMDRGMGLQCWCQMNWSGSGAIVFAVDGLSIYLVLLTTLLVPICVLISWRSIVWMVKEYVLCLLVVELLLVGVFTIMDLIGFYVLFESVLIPMFLIIGVWGGRSPSGRLATYYFVMYTLAGSVFMLLGILALYGFAGTTGYLGLRSMAIPTGVQYYAYVGLFLGLAVKVPMMPFHIWLPLAHVEAPVAGSVLLAGVLLKIGGYGLIRFAWSLLPGAFGYFGPLALTLSTLGVIYGSLTTCRQIDMKRIVAYSSVAHMGLVTLGIFSQSSQGQVAAAFLMLAHGLVSSALFIAVTCLYDRHQTRLVKYYRGMTGAMPLFSALTLALVLANASVPLSCNFVGEFMSFVAAFGHSSAAGVLVASGIVLSAVYSLYMYNRVCGGAPSRYVHFSRDLARRDFYVLFLLVVLVYVLGIWPSVALNDITVACPQGR